MLNSYHQEFLLPEETNFNIFIDKLNLFHSKITNTTNVKQSSDGFLLKNNLDNLSISNNGKDTETVYNELKTMFDGAIRPHSTNSCFNMVPTPLLDSVVASTFTQLYNINLISSQFGGNTLQFEQIIAKSIGELVGWNDATGISCSGGKATLLYALKAAISRICPNSLLYGISSDLVVIAQESSHYSLEHVCSILGIGSKNIIRIPAYEKWQMNPIILEEKINETIESGKKIAAIFCCGGTTINFASDNTQDIINVVNKIFSNNKYGYFPYLHLDSVIGWLWLTFLNYKGKINKYTDNLLTINSIEEVIDKFSGVKYFDSFGVDFHKNGLCTYSSSMFIVKSKNILLKLGDGNSNLDEIHNDDGNISAFRYTFENSRSASGISSAYVALSRLGKDGLRKYLVNMLDIKHNLAAIMEQMECIKIVNLQSCGWEIVFDVDFTEINAKQETVAYSFINYIWSKVDKGCQDTPLLSIVPNYKTTYDSLPKTMFLCYPMSLLLLEDVTELAKKINQAIVEFKLHIKQNELSLNHKIYTPIK